MNGSKEETQRDLYVSRGAFVPGYFALDGMGWDGKGWSNYLVLFRGVEHGRCRDVSASGPRGAGGDVSGGWRVLLARHVPFLGGDNQEAEMDDEDREREKNERMECAHGCPQKFKIDRPNTLHSHPLQICKLRGGTSCNFIFYQHAHRVFV